MKLVFQRGACGNGRTCPNLNTTDRGTYVVQGYIPTCEQPASPDEAIVEVPLSLLPELADSPYRTGDNVLLRGAQVTDLDAIGELNLPAGENAIEVPLSLLLRREMASA